MPDLSADPAVAMASFGQSRGGANPGGEVVEGLQNSRGQRHWTQLSWDLRIVSVPGYGINGIPNVFQSSWAMVTIGHWSTKKMLKNAKLTSGPRRKSRHWPCLNLPQGGEHRHPKDGERKTLVFLDLLPKHCKKR